MGSKVIYFTSLCEREALNLLNVMYLSMYDISNCLRFRCTNNLVQLQIKLTFINKTHYQTALNGKVINRVPCLNSRCVCIGKFMKFYIGQCLTYSSFYYFSLSEYSRFSNMPACEVCGKILATVFTLNRHMDLVHIKKDDEEETMDSSTVGEEDEEDDMEDGINSEDDASEASEGSTGYGSDFWTQALTWACQNMKTIPTSVDSLKNMEYFPQLMDLIRKYYDNHKFLQSSLENSDIENKMADYQEYLKEKIFEDEDAEELSWEHMKFLFKRLIDNNEDIFVNELRRRQDDNE